MLIKSKAAYYSIYLFWTIVFGILCLMMGAASGLDPTFDRILDFCDLTYGNKEYVEESGPSKEMDGTIYLTYYTKRDIDENLLCKIVKDNKFICKPYALEEAEVEQISKKMWGIQADGEALGTIEIKNNLFMREICYMWDKAKLEGRRE